jgi:hypothetical protein
MENSISLQFNSVNLKTSKLIYQELIRGRLINRMTYSNKSQGLEGDPLFLELRQNIEQYKLQYRMMDMTLEDKESYFYLVANDNEKANNQLFKSKVYAALIVMVRYITHDNNKLYEIIENVNYGVSAEDFENIHLDDKYGLIIERAKLVNIEQIIKFLSEKNILLKTVNDKYILSESGKSIINSIIDVYKEAQ